MRIVLTGGGTGGHLFPLLAVADELKKSLGAEAELLYIGSGVALEKEVMQNAGIPAKFVKSGKMRRYFALANFVDIFKIPVGFLQALWILLRFMPDAVFSKGGYAAVPVVLAAWVYRIPVIIHESDAAAGAANKFLGSFAVRIAVAYPGAKKFFPEQKVSLIGNPVRAELIGGDGRALRQELGLSEVKKTVFVIGGSQGSRIINQSIGKILPKILKIANVLHATGEAGYDEAVSLAANEGIKAGRDGYFPFKFMNVGILRDAYALADVVVSRAGANSIAEIAATQKPAILIPLDNAANDHQRKNAYEIANAGGAIVLEENNLGENMLLQKIEKIINDQEYAAKMSQSLAEFYHPSAAKMLAAGIIELNNQ